MTDSLHRESGEFRTDDRTWETDDEHVVDMVLLPPPEHLIRFFPIQGSLVETLVATIDRLLSTETKEKDE